MCCMRWLIITCCGCEQISGWTLARVFRDNFETGGAMADLLLAFLFALARHTREVYIENAVCTKNKIKITKHEYFSI